MNDEKPTNRKEAFLLIASGCAHCTVMLTTLSQMLKEGQLARLNIINISEAPDAAASFNVRSVPWTQIGAVQFTGVKTRLEVEHLLSQQLDGGNLADYIQQQLAEGQLDAVSVLLHERPEHLPTLLKLLTDDELPIQVRIGIGALLEEFTGTPVLVSQIPLLNHLSENSLPSLRGDATYYLSLTHHPDALAAIRRRLTDEVDDVCEIAREAEEELSNYLK